MNEGLKTMHTEQQTQINQQPATGVDPNTWLQWAQYYGSLGFAVLPLRGKIPLTPRGVYDASADPNVWLQWVQQFPGCNIGLAVPDGCAVIDVDPRNGGATTFDRLDDVEHAIPRDTLQVTTGGGGLHVFVQLAAGYALPSTLGPGVDVKQLGGYVVAAPSVHPDTGQHYRVTRDAPVAYAPATLVARAVPRGASKAKALAADEIDDVRRDAAGWGLDPDLVVQDVTPEQIQQAVRAVESIYVPGQRHHVRVKMGSVLNRLGWSAASVEAFGHALYEEYGGDNENKIAREAVRGMGYPSGYYDLLEMLPAGAQREALAQALDALPNPYGAHLREARAASAADVLTRLAKIESARHANDTSLPSADELKAYTLDEMATFEMNASSFVCRDYGIKPGPPSIIVGRAGAGKSWLANTLMAQVAAGRSFLDTFDVNQHPERRGAVFLSLEMERDLTADRWKRTYAALNLPMQGDGVVTVASRKLCYVEDNAEIQSRMREWLVRMLTGRAIAVIDPLRSFHRYGEENDTSFRNVIDWLADVSEETRCAIVLLHHAGKGTKENPLDVLRGSSGILDASGSVIALTRESAEDAKSAVIMSHIRNRSGECMPPVRLEFDGGAYRVATASEGVVASKPRTKEARINKSASTIKSRIDNAVGEVTLPELVKLCSEDQDIVSRACAKLEKMGSLRLVRGAGQARWRIASAVPRDHHATGAMPASNVVRMKDYLPPGMPIAAPRAVDVKSGPPALPDASTFAPMPGGGFTPDRPTPAPVAPTSTLDSAPLALFLAQQKLRCAQGGGSFTLTEAVRAKGDDPADANARARVSKAIIADGFFDKKDAPRRRGAPRETEFRPK